MASDKKKEKRREQRARKKELLEKADAIREELDSIEPEEVLPEVIEKDYVGDIYMGPTSFEEVDALEVAQHEAQQVNELTYKVQDLVRSITYTPPMMMSPEEKAKKIKAVGEEYGKRLKQVTGEPMKKEIDIDLLELEVFIAQDHRQLPFIEKIGDFLTKAKLTTSAENALSDSDFALVREEDGKKDRKYPIHDKAHVRNALARATQQIKEGGAGAADAKAALPAIRAAAKKMGIGDMEKSKNSVVVQKDISGKWRAVMWPTNNFQDSDGEIISKEAHEEYVEWVNQNMDCAPVFVSWHTPATRRESRVDFITYENGFILASAPLTEKEARGLLRLQLKTDLGMSHGSFDLGRDPKDPNIVTKYRTVEYSDLPIEKAANPFTEFSVLIKEAAMDKLQYLTALLGDEDQAKTFFEKAGLKQEALRDAGVKEKETKDPDPKDTPDDNQETPEPVGAEFKSLTPELQKEVLALVSKELDVPGLTDTIKNLMEKAEQGTKDAEKVEILEALVKDLSKSTDEKLAEKIAPKALPWSQVTRPSQSKETILKEGSEEDEKLSKSIPEVGWLSEMTNTTPVQVSQ